MKKKLLIACCLFGLATLHAQSSVYKIFPDTNFTWVENYGGAPGGGCCCAGICLNSWDYQYFYDGKSLIGNQWYGKLYKTGSFSASALNPVCPPSCLNNNTTTYYVHQASGFIREDSAARKVFYHDGTQEVLLYDFSLQPGDSAKGLAGNPTVNYISQVDSVQVGNNFHKRFGIAEWNSGSTYAYIIEGLGGTQGLLQPIVPLFEFWGTLICAYEGTTPVYPANQPGCFIPDGINTPEAATAVPVVITAAGTNRYTVYTAEKMHGQLYSNDGKLLHDFIFNAGTTGVDMNKYPAGIYLLRFCSERQAIYTHKIIIQH